MGILLDIVPNHMGTGPDNPFWEDLLAIGRRSQWAATAIVLPSALSATKLPARKPSRGSKRFRSISAR